MSGIRRGIWASLTKGLTPPQPTQRMTGASGICRVIAERTSRRLRRFPCEDE
jgi:hypothetical protein